MANKELIEQLDLNEQQKALALLACVAQETKIKMERLISATGLSLLQLNILHTLDYSSDGSLSVNQLKSSMLDETPNVSRTLNKLVDMGMVTKHRSSEDQRVVFIRITDQGRKAHHTADEASLQFQSPLNEQESQQLCRLLAKF